MPSACCAVDCTNRNTPESGLVFYRIPKRNVKQRELWLKAIKRENWSGNKLSSAKLCSAHFISGKFCCWVYCFLLFFAVLPPKKL